MHEIDVYALVLSILLFFVAFMIFLNNWTIVRSAWFPILCGSIFIILTAIDAFTETFRKHTAAKDNIDFELPFEVYSVNEMTQPATGDIGEHHPYSPHQYEPALANGMQAKRNNTHSGVTINDDPHDFCEMLENARKIRATMIRQPT